MTHEAILSRVDKLNVWQRGAERAPHKPLLLLLALGRQSRGLTGPVLYEDLSPELASLLREFGPSRRAYHPEYPFWRLQNDGVWVVESDRPMRTRASNSDPPKSELLGARARGRLDPAIVSAITESPELLPAIANRLLEAHFPHSIHADILSAVGLATDNHTTSSRRRDPKFRERIMVAYERRCAVCDFDVRIGSVSIGIEAAHIRWHQAGGPDEETNGLALCSTHHKTFDLGAFTIDPTDGLLVSEQVTGSSELDHILLRHHGQPVRPPQHHEHRPDSGFLAWHRRQVFKEGPRSAPAK